MSEIVYSLDKIQRIIEKDELEDKMFFRFLERVSYTKSRSDDFDNIMYQIYQKVKGEIDCTKCANCCIEVDVPLCNKDIEIFSKVLGISVESFKVKYVVASKWGLEIKKPCPFLDSKRCLYYEYRPLICRTYPFDMKEPFHRLLVSISMNYDICPIMFNTYQWLKTYYWDVYEGEEG